MEESLSEQVIAELKEVFTLFDKYCDGTISTKSLESVLITLGKKVSEAELSHFIQTFDPNKEGIIDFPSFLSIVAQKENDEDTEEEVRSVFQTLFDKEDKGRISIIDLRHVLKLHANLSDDEVDVMIREFGASGESSVDFEEFITLMMSK